MKHQHAAPTKIPSGCRCKSPRFSGRPKLALRTRPDCSREHICHQLCAHHISDLIPVRQVHGLECVGRSELALIMSFRHLTRNVGTWYENGRWSADSARIAAKKHRTCWRLIVGWRSTSQKHSQTCFAWATSQRILFLATVLYPHTIIYFEERFRLSCGSSARSSP